MAEVTTNANLDINTSQPKPLRGLKLRGIKETEQVTCEHTDADGNTKIIKVAADRWDKKIHGPKVDEDKLPARKAGKKKAPKKKAAEGE